MWAQILHPVTKHCRDSGSLWVSGYTLLKLNDGFLVALRTSCLVLSGSEKPGTMASVPSPPGWVVTQTINTTSREKDTEEVERKVSMVDRTEERARKRFSQLVSKAKYLPSASLVATFQRDSGGEPHVRGAGLKPW